MSVHKYFLGSYFLTIFGVITAYLWGEHVHSGAGLVSAHRSHQMISETSDNPHTGVLRSDPDAHGCSHPFVFCARSVLTHPVSSSGVFRGL